ncbi:MAG: hypothetical protein NTV75_05525 [Bacteroidia bacterium]|nr:hypothetical protein [Bacteroidia bacterium]
MRKLMLGFLALALVFTSCNKYANDFSALKDQITALDVKVNGVVALQSQLTATTAQVTALQTAVAALPTSASIAALSTGLATANTNIAAAQTALTALATSGTATKAVVDGLKTDLTALAATVAANNTALNTKVDANNTAAVAANTAAIAANAALSTKITAAQASLDALTTFTGTLATQAVVNALTVKVDAAQAGINTLLAAAAVYAGNIFITTDNEVDFIAPSFASLGMINGNLTVNTTAISAGKIAKLNGILNNLVGAFGPTTISVTTTALKPLSFNNLAAITGNLTVIGRNLSSVSTVVFPLLTSVTGDLNLNLDGAYSYTSTLTIGGNLTLTDKATAAGVTGTLGVSIPNWVVTGTISDGVAAGTPTFAAATGINMPTGTSTSITANAATLVAITGNVPATFTLNANNAATVTLGRATALTALTISATKAASSVTVTAPSITGALSITGSATSTIGLPTLATAGAAVSVAGLLSAPVLTTTTGLLTLTAGTTTSLPVLATATAGITANALTSLSLPALATAGAAISATSATTVSLPALKLTVASTFTAATTVTLLSTTQTNLTVAANPSLVNLTLLGLSEVYTTTNTTTLKNVDITGLAGFTNEFTYSVPAAAANSALITATFKGAIATVAINGFGDATTKDKLTSVTTAGVINSFTLNNSDVIASISLGHQAFADATLIVTNNDGLLALTTSTNKLAVLTVTGNTKLAAADFASYTTQPTAATAAITVSGNKLAYTYTNAVAGTPTTAYVETTITSAALHTLKAYVAAATTPNLLVNLDYIGATAKTLSASMAEDAAIAHAAWAAATGITIQSEFALVQ